MNKELGTEEEALLLKQLRKAIGLDSMTLATQNGLSHAQIQQLQNGATLLFTRQRSMPKRVAACCKNC
jgi:hypothetical protein